MPGLVGAPGRVGGPGRPVPSVLSRRIGLPTSSSVFPAGRLGAPGFPVRVGAPGRAGPPWRWGTPVPGRTGAPTPPVRRGTGLPTSSGRGVGRAGVPVLVGAPTRGGVPGRGGAPARETICGFWPWAAPGRLGAAAGRGVGRDGACFGADVEGALGVAAAAALLGRGVGAVGLTIVGFAAAGFATTAGLAGVIGFATIAGLAAAAGFVAAVGLPTSSGADALLTTCGLGAPWGFDGAGRLGDAAGRGAEVVPVGRAGGAVGLFGADVADVGAVVDPVVNPAGRDGGATAFTDG